MKSGYDILDLIIKYLPESIKLVNQIIQFEIYFSLLQINTDKQMYLMILLFTVQGSRV